MITILKRSLSSVTYSSPCIPDGIAERGLEVVPNVYYRDDGLKLLNIIYSYYRQFLFCVMFIQYEDLHLVRVS